MRSNAISEVLLRRRNRRAGRLKKAATHIPVLAVSLAAALERADVLGAVALLVGVAHVAVHEVIRRRQTAATGLTGLAASVLRAVLTVNLDDLAAALEQAARDRAGARFDVRIQGIRRRVAGGVNDLFGVGTDKAGDLVFHRLPGRFGSFRHGWLLGVDRRPG